MKKLDNKGFMLVEVVIVSAVLITTIVGLYSGFSSTYRAYETKNAYYDVKSMYALKNLEDFMVDEFLLNNMVTSTDFKYKQIDGNEETFNDYQKKFLDQFKSIHNINKIYLLRYEEDVINEFANSIKDENKEFFDYLKFYIDNETGEDAKLIGEYDYMLVAITNNDTYATLRIE